MEEGSKAIYTAFIPVFRKAELCSTGDRECLTGFPKMQYRSVSELIFNGFTGTL
jgi:hypothetical protein